MLNILFVEKLSKFFLTEETAQFPKTGSSFINFFVFSTPVFRKHGFWSFENSNNNNQIKMERSEMEIVKDKIAEGEAKLARAEEAGDRDMVIMLGNNLAELRKNKNLLLAQSSAGNYLHIVSLLFLIYFV
jgi:hypothetical protein